MNVPLRVMCDTNIFDKIIECNSFFDSLLQAVSDDRLAIITTHIQREELAACADQVRRNRLLSVPTRMVATDGAVWNISVWGQSRWGGGSTDLTIEKIMSEAGNHARDALIGATASAEADVLVTEDKRLRKKVRAGRTKLQVWSFGDFASFIEGHGS